MSQSLTSEQVEFLRKLRELQLEALDKLEQYFWMMNEAAKTLPHSGKGG